MNHALEPLPTPFETTAQGDGAVRTAIVLSTSAGGDGMELFRKLWRRRGTIVVATLATALVAALATLGMTPRYTAETQLLVGLATPDVADMTSVLKGIDPNEETIETEGYVLESRGLAAQVVHRLALDQDPEFNPMLRHPSFLTRAYYFATDFVHYDVMDPLRGLFGARAGQSKPLTDAERAARRQSIVTDVLLDRIDVTPLKKSHVLDVTVQSQSPALAARIANTLAQVYIDQEMVRKASAAQHATSFLDQQIARLRTQAENAERAVEEYRQKNGLYETKSDTVTAQQIDELNQQLIISASARATAMANLEQARAVEHNPAAIDTLPTVVDSPLIQALKEKEVEIERTQAQLASIYGPDHPKIRDIKAQLADVRSKIAIEVRKVVEALQRQAQAANAQYQSLSANLAHLQNELGAANGKSIQLNQLQQQADAAQALLTNFLNRSKETSAQEDLDAPDATVISAATPPDRPNYPPTGMIVLLGTIGGSFVGMLIALVRENLDRSFRTGDDIERTTRLPLLAMIPSFKGQEFAKRPLAFEPDSPFTSSIRTLYTRLAMSGGATSPKLIMLTSAAPHEGKSRIAIAIARLAAQAGHRVIVVDCDWQRPIQHSFFRRPMSPGLADLLSGSATPEQAVYLDPGSRVHALFAGKIGTMEDHPQRFARLRLLCKTLARHYDLVVVDAPPVLAGSEVLPLSRMMDRVAFVVKWGDTPRDVVMSALRQLYYARGRVAGTVLSQVDPKRYRRYGVGEVTYPYRRMSAVRTL